MGKREFSFPRQMEGKNKNKVAMEFPQRPYFFESKVLICSCKANC